MLLQGCLSLRLLLLLFITVAAQTDATPIKDIYGHDIDLNHYPPQSPGEQHASEAVEAGESSHSVYDPTTLTANARHEAQSSLQEGRGRSRSLEQVQQSDKGEKIWDKKFEHHRQVAIRLRHKVPSTLSAEDRQELSKTREYLGKVIRYNQLYGSNHERLAECEDLLGNLRGGRWNKYIGPMDKKDVWMKNEAKRVYAGRKRLQEERGEASPAPSAKRGRDWRRIPDEIITPAQLKTRRHNEQSKARLKAKKAREQA